MMIETLKKRPLQGENADQSAGDEIIEGPALPAKKHKSTPAVAISDKENVGESGMLPRGLHNESNTCYLNSLIQVLFHLLPLRELVFNLSPQHYSQKLGVVEALQWLFLDLQEGTDNSEIVTTTRLTKAFGWTSVNRGLQQDIHEFMQTLFNCLEKELNTDDFQRFSSLFTGKLERCIRCEEVGYKSVKYEEVRGLSLATISFMNIDRSLEDMFRSEQVQMTIEDHGKQTAEIKVELREVPKVLLLTLNRLKYDPVEQAVVKVTDYFEYKEKLELCAHTYRLHSAVVHEGTATSGHYYCYINTTCNNQWYMLNDDKVSHSSVNCAVKDNYGSKAECKNPTAYLLTYVREDCAEFFTRTETSIPEKLRERIHSVRQLEKARLERIQTAHLYTTISLVTWAMLKGHSGYDLCDRLKLDQLHKDGEGREADGISTLRVLKSSTVQELIAAYDSSLTQNNVRLWSFTDRPTNDGWSTHRPDKLIKDWNSTIAMVSKLRCPFYVYIERLDCDLHPITLDDDNLSVFVKVFHQKQGTQAKPLVELHHHLILSIDSSIDSLKCTVFRLSNIDVETADALIYQEQSSMSTELVECDGDTALCEALGSQLLRHASILIVEVVDRLSAIDTDTAIANKSSQQSTSITNAEAACKESAEERILSEEEHSSDDGVVRRGSTRQGLVVERMRQLGTKVMVTWYNKSLSYLPSQVDGEFTLELYTDMKVCDVIARLSEHLGCGGRNVLVYEAKRDQGYPQIQELPVYDSGSKECLLKLLYKQVQHSTLWRHSAVLYYQQLAMSIEELSIRHTVTCNYVSADLTAHTLTLYPHKCTQGTNRPSTVDDLMLLADSEIRLLSDIQSSRPLRLLSITNKRIARVYSSEHLISSLLQEELRLERVSEEEEEAESEFSVILASVTIDSAYLLRRGVPSAPFLMVIGHSDSGPNIIEKINSRLKVSDQWREKVEYRLVIPGEKSYVLTEGKLSVRDWGNLAYDDDTGSFDGCNYIKVLDAPRIS